jgi:hypothetical protein
MMPPIQEKASSVTVRTLVTCISQSIGLAEEPSQAQLSLLHWRARSDARNCQSAANSFHHTDAISGVHPTGLANRRIDSDLYRSRWLGDLWREEALNES